MFVLPNLSSSVVAKGPLPWDVDPGTFDIPEDVRTDKKLRDKWICTPATRHHVYSFYEGHIDSMRLRVATGTDEGNPPRYCFGLVADYDHPLPEDEALAICRKCSTPPNRVEKTLSGNWRAIWLFETPISVVSFDWMTKFLKSFDKFGFNVSGLLPGFDEKAWWNPTRYWTNSGQWTKMNPNPISESVITGWVIKFNSTYNFARNEATKIPLEILVPALKEKFGAAFDTWPGEFTLGSQGPTFWVPASKSPKSAIVHDGGIYTFSGNASQSFYSWADLLGREFVGRFEANKLGLAAKDIYKDMKNYHRKLPNGDWQVCNKDTVVTHLKVNCGLSSDADKSGPSELDRCLSHIHDHQSVDGAAHFVFRPDGVLTMNSKRILNKSRMRVIQPAAELTPWGEAGEYPWSSRYLNHLLADAPLEWVIAWSSIAYRSGYLMQPQQGHALYLAGDTGIGKTLFGTAIFGKLMGGSMEVADVLTGGSNFNSEIFEYAVATVDDGSVSTTDTEHRRYSEGIKRMVANGRHKVNEKFCVGTSVEWLGRVVGTLNIDGESVRQLPNMDISTLDKISIVRCKPDDGFKFPPRHELDKILAKELPHLAKFLLEYKIPEHLLGDSRYVIKPYHDETLLKSTHRNSTSGQFEEIFSDFLEGYFKDFPKAEAWSGTAYQLHKEILMDPSAQGAMRSFSVSNVSRQLGKLVARGLPIEAKEEKHRIVYTVKKTYLSP